MSLDLAAEVVAALRSPAGREALADAVRAALDGAHQQPDPDELITVKQAAELRGVSPAAIYAQVAEGNLTAIRHGKRGRAIRLRRGDVTGAGR